VHPSLTRGAGLLPDFVSTRSFRLIGVVIVVGCAYGFARVLQMIGAEEDRKEEASEE
jgi:hypothetical protein